MVDNILNSSSEQDFNTSNQWIILEASSLSNFSSLSTSNNSIPSVQNRMRLVGAQHIALIAYSTFTPRQFHPVPPTSKHQLPQLGSNL